MSNSGTDRLAVLIDADKSITGSGLNSKHKGRGKVETLLR